VRLRDAISCHVTATCCELQPSRSSIVLETWLTRLLQPLPGDFRSNDVTSDHFRSREVVWVISSHVTATSCKLQPCRSSNAPKTWFIGLLQPLPGDFRSNHVTSGSLPVTWDHVTSFPVTWQPSPASYRPVKPQTYPKLDLQAFYSHFRVTSGQMSFPVTWSQVASFPVTRLPPPASYRTVGAQTYPKLDVQVLYSHFQVTSGQKTSFPDHFLSRVVLDVISCHVTATCCELQPCTSSTVLETWLTGLLQPFPGNFRSKDVKSGSLPVTWRHFLSRHCNLPRVTAL